MDFGQQSIQGQREELRERGFAHFAGFLLEDELVRLEGMLPKFDRPGIRASGLGLTELARLDELARALCGSAARPVRAILFDKSQVSNWSLDWHQDRTIWVRARAEVPGFGSWTVKSDMVHVEPPFELIERMVTLRLHFDQVTRSNGPLRVAPGSHRLGRIDESGIRATVRELGEHSCLASRGDVWVYHSTILHASQTSESSSRRRVLHVDYSPIALPAPLEWGWSPS